MGFTDRAKDTAKDIADKAGDAAESIKGKAQDLGDDLSDKGQEVGEKVEDRAEDAKDTAKSFNGATSMIEVEDHALGWPAEVRAVASTGPPR